MHDEDVGLKELTHKPDYGPDNINLITVFTCLYYVGFYMEREVRRSKYSMMVFSEPNRSKLVLPPLPYWWVLMCTPHRK